MVVVPFAAADLSWRVDSKNQRFLAQAAQTLTRSDCRLAPRRGEDKAIRLRATLDRRHGQRFVPRGAAPLQEWSSSDRLDSWKEIACVPPPRCPDSATLARPRQPPGPPARRSSATGCLRLQVQSPHAWANHFREEGEEAQEARPSLEDGRSGTLHVSLAGRATVVWWRF